MQEEKGSQESLYNTWIKWASLQLPSLAEAKYPNRTAIRAPSSAWAGMSWNILVHAQVSRKHSEYCLAEQVQYSVNSISNGIYVGQSPQMFCSCAQHTFSRLGETPLWLFTAMLLASAVSFLAPYSIQFFSSSPFLKLSVLYQLLCTHLHKCNYKRHW